MAKFLFISYCTNKIISLPNFVCCIASKCSYTRNSFNFTFRTALYIYIGIFNTRLLPKRYVCKTFCRLCNGGDDETYIIPVWAQDMKSGYWNVSLMLMKEAGFKPTSPSPSLCIANKAVVKWVFETRPQKTCLLHDLRRCQQTKRRY